MLEARTNPSKRLSIQRVTEEMIKKNPEQYPPRSRNDVEIWGDQMPAHVRLFECRGCVAGGGNRDNMRAGQMADHVNLFHKGRGDVISKEASRWATRQAALAQQMTIAVRQARKEEKEIA